MNLMNGVVECGSTADDGADAIRDFHAIERQQGVED
jgi:hypothetical protein